MTVLRNPPAQPTQGWARPTDSRKFHFFQPSQSGALEALCRKWAWMKADAEHLEMDGGTQTKEDCATCWKKLTAQRVKAVKP